MTTGLDTQRQGDPLQPPGGQIGTAGVGRGHHEQKQEADPALPPRNFCRDRAQGSLGQDPWGGLGVGSLVRAGQNWTPQQHGSLNLEQGSNWLAGQLWLQVSVRSSSLGPGPRTLTRGGGG